MKFLHANTANGCYLLNYCEPEASVVAVADLYDALPSLSDGVTLVASIDNTAEDAATLNKIRDEYSISADITDITGVALDTCADCGAEMMPVALGDRPAGWVDTDWETYCQCVGCGGRAGHRTVPTNTAADHRGVGWVVCCLCGTELRGDTVNAYHGHDGSRPVYYPAHAGCVEDEG